MAKLLNVSINLSKIDKSKLIEGKKGKYLNLTISVNDQKNDFDQDVSCWQGQSKEEVQNKEAKNYLGNGKVFWSSDQSADVAKVPSVDQLPKAPVVEAEPDDLPF